MSNPASKMPIKTKLMLVIFLTSFAVLVLENIGFLTYERLQHKNALIQHIDSFAQIISTRSVESLTVRDKKTVQDILEIANVEKQIVAACIYDSQGQIFTRFDSGQEHAFEFFDLVNVPRIAQIENGYLQLSEPIMRGDERIGTVFIRANLSEFNVQWYQFLLVSGVLLIILSLITFVSAFRLRLVVLHPIHHISAKVHSIVINKNYTSRLTVEGNDEISHLSHAFNHTFQAIEARDHALQRCHARLAAFEQKIDYPPDLLALVSLHIADGIDHNGGHINAYRKQLFRFRKHFADAITQLRNILLNDDDDELAAISFCNALKGVSGNIGAMSVFHFTSTLVSNLREGKLPDEHDFNRLEQLLTDVFRDIDSLKIESVENAPIKRDISVTQLVKTVQELLTTLEHDLGESEKLLSQLSELASGSEFETQVKAISVQIDEFNIEQATLLLTDLQQRLLI